MMPMAEREAQQELWWGTLVSYARAAGAKDRDEANAWALDAFAAAGSNLVQCFYTIDTRHPPEDS